MLEIELLQSCEVDRAAKILLRDGFVAIKNLLQGEQLRNTQAAATRVIDEIVSQDPERKGNRGYNRYSFGNQMRYIEWCQLTDISPVLQILETVWASNDFICSGNGGDFSMPGAEIQPLHSDGNELGFYDPLGQTTIRDLPPPFVCVNFLMTDFTKQNGAIRQIPGTHRSRNPIPTLEEEPSWMKNSIICAPAGTGLIRDVRCWHGGTANHSDHARPMTNAHYCAPWFRTGLTKSIPKRHFEKMSDRAQHLCRFIAEDD